VIEIHFSDVKTNGVTLHLAEAGPRLLAQGFAAQRRLRIVIPVLLIWDEQDPFGARTCASELGANHEEGARCLESSLEFLTEGAAKAPMTSP
jgi:hypothetical protein